MKRTKFTLSLAAASCAISGCLPPQPSKLSFDPAKQYTNNLRASGIPTRTDLDVGREVSRRPSVNWDSSNRAQLRRVSDEMPPEDKVGSAGVMAAADSPKMISNDGVFVQQSTMQNSREYQGPLALGEPGVTSSLWRESRTLDLFRDSRAFQPMDLITIIVSESSEGAKTADTEVKSKSTLTASIEKLLGIEASLQKRNPALDPAAPLIGANVTNEYKGEGDTSRKGTLKAQISAMVVEVLPSGILRIEGQKIVSVNSEEELMEVSGLVRPKDINSNNEVQSAKIANLRIDYSGTGIIGEAQHGGWLGRLLRIVWPF